MQITSLKLENFGRHRLIEFDCDAGIVGVLGPNGSGKSTVLDAIQFVITGEARDNLPTYVRNFQGNASATVQFRKNGKVGTIFRQIGSTSKRSLTYDGHEYKKAADVDKQMSAIFGSDKKALANSVFVNQGTIANILFRTEGRRKAFIRLVNLSFCEKNAGVVSQQIDNLAATVVDLTPARDEASAARTQALTNYDALKAALDAYQDRSVELAHLQALNSHRIQIGLLEKQLGESLVQIQGKRSEFYSHLPGGGEIQTIQDFWTALEAAQTDATNARTTASDCSSIMSELVHYNRITGEITSLKNESINLSRESETLNPDKLAVAHLEEEVKRVAAVLKTHADRLTVQTEIDNLNRQMSAQTTALSVIPEPPANENCIAESQLELTQKSAQKQQLDQWMALQNEIANATAGCDLSNPADCPKCGLRLLSLHQLDTSNLVALESSIGSLSEEIKELQEKIRTDRLSLNEYLTKTSRAKGLIQSTELNLKKKKLQLDGLVVTTDAGTDQQEHDRLENIRVNVVRIAEAQRTILTQTGQKKASLVHYPKAVQFWNTRTEYTAAKYAELNNKATELEKKHQDLAQKYNLAYGVHTQLEQLETDHGTKDAQYQELNDAMNSPAPGVYNELLTQCNGNVTQLEAELANNECSRLEAGTRAEASLKVYQDANKRFQDLETRIEQDKAKLGLIKDLKRLRDLLSDDGVPMAFVKNKFEILAQHTQDGLAQMNADFFINVDKDAELSFTFVRTNEPVQYDLPMEKLSGGQRVRMCLAFLMALQKTLIRDVGFLVLDEPSTSVDSNGVDQMVEFLVGLRAELKNADHQIWLVDHNPKLARAMEKSLVLS